jgi:hypothetical protein
MTISLIGNSLIKLMKVCNGNSLQNKLKIKGTFEIPMLEIPLEWIIYYMNVTNE